MDTGWRDHINAGPDVCHGQAWIRGTRIPGSVVLDNVAAGIPALTPDGVRAAAAYAADLARETMVAWPKAAS